MRKKLFFLTLVLIAFTSFQLWRTQGEQIATPTADSAEAGQGQALVGGDFTLTDQNGATVRDVDFRGRAMLVFFGFTHCPDICPVTVSTLSQLMQQLGEKASRVAPVFITVDPARDTPEVLKQYFAHFDARIMALTGSEEQVRAAASAYKAYYAKKEEPADKAHGAHDHAAGAADYMVDHSGYIYLMDTQGKFVRVFPYNTDVPTLAAALEPYVK